MRNDAHAGLANAWRRDRLREYSLFSLMARSVCLLLLSLLSGAGATDEVDCKSMRVKQLRTFLHQRGVKCEGCAEKSDFLALCEQHKDTPVVEEPEPPKGSDPSVGDGKGEKNIDDILAGLKGMPGMDGIKMFSGDDLKNMNFEQMGKQFGGSGAAKKKTRSQYRRELVDFYKRYDITYTDEGVEKAMEKFKGKESSMFDKLHKKYDAEIKAYYDKEDQKYKESTDTVDSEPDTAEDDEALNKAFGKKGKDEV